MSEKNMNFLPEDYLERRAHRRTNLLSVTLFIIVMVGVVAAYVMSDKQRAEAVAERDRVDSQFAEAADRLDQLRELQARKEQMLRKARLTGTLLERLPRSVILSQVINNMPVTMTLYEFELETKAVKKKSRARTSLAAKKNAARAARSNAAFPKPKDVVVSMKLVGIARTDVDVSEFMRGLDQSPLFRAVSLSYSEEIVIEDEKLRKFEVHATINHTVDLNQFEPEMVKRDLKQNPWGGTIAIDKNGELYSPKRQPIDNANIVDATPRRGLGND